MSSRHDFKNSILLVVFNWSYLIHTNKNAIKKLYEKHFKQLIFYADYPIENDDEVNFIPINYGYNAHKIFNHFYEKYKSLIDESDGVFYTMDDNIINVNILNLFDSSKIIYYHSEVKPVDAHSGWWWESNCDGKYGKHAIHRLMQDDEFKKYNMDKFSGHGAAGDWFYLPKKYLTPALFHLFDLFSKHEVFLEIAIPSAINNMEKAKSQYQLFTDEILWGERDNYSKKEYVYKSLNHRHHFILHPIKFKENPRAVEWLNDIFHKEKCVIITTINAPTETILKHIKNEEYDVIIVGDNKTPSEQYANLNCIYLDVPSQKKLFPELSELLPYNHYCRKNLGYLYAIKKGYKIIYETDDDNVPHDNFDMVLHDNDGLQMITEQNNAWINIFKYFTNNGYIWPRGFPLSLLKHNPNYSIQPTDKTPSIINGLVENDPDVDALFRIICNHQHCIQWEKNKRIMINNRNVCVFNSQNTFWLNPEVFMCLLIPCSVSFRYCDILRGIISNIILKKTNNCMMYASPNVTQYRNEHDLMSDFKSEYEMYIHNENILKFIEKGVITATSLKETMLVIYNNLLENAVVAQNDLDILKKWSSYFHPLNFPPRKKYNITHFYSEGLPNDNGKDLKYCRETLIERHKCFDNIMFYTPKLLRDMGYEKYVKEHEVTNINTYYATMCKIGLSAWKPLIMLLELEKMEMGDILVYRDCDFKKYDALLANDDMIETVDKLLNIVNFDFFMPRQSELHVLKSYTKPIVLKELGNDDAFNKDFPLLMCGFIIVRKSEISIEFLNEWKDACLIDKYIDGHLYDVHSPDFVNFTTNEQSICGTIVANWVKTRKHNIPIKYPMVGFNKININQLVYFDNYYYLTHLK